MRYFSSPGSPRHAMDSRDGTPKREWVAPFGNPGIEGCSHLPRAYRSVPRPSSPLDAKASTRCPSFTRPAPATLFSATPRHLPRRRGSRHATTKTVRQQGPLLPTKHTMLVRFQAAPFTRNDQELNEHDTRDEPRSSTRRDPPMMGNPAEPKTVAHHRHRARSDQTCLFTMYKKHGTEDRYDPDPRPNPRTCRRSTDRAPDESGGPGLT